MMRDRSAFLAEFCSDGINEDCDGATDCNDADCAAEPACQGTWEIEVGATFLEDLTGQTEFTIAYPYGFHDENTHRAMRELGLRAGLTMERRAIGPQDLRDRWSIPRYDVNDCFDRESNQLLDPIFSQIAAGEPEATG